MAVVVEFQESSVQLRSYDRRSKSLCSKCIMPSQEISSWAWNCCCLVNAVWQGRRCFARAWHRDRTCRPGDCKALKVTKFERHKSKFASRKCDWQSERFDLRQVMSYANHCSVSWSRMLFSLWNLFDLSSLCLLYAACLVNSIWPLSEMFEIRSLPVLF